MAKRTITVIKGDGIGPSIIDSALEILKAAGCDFNYEFVEAGLTALENTGELLPQSTLDAIVKNKMTLKGPLTTPVGEGFTSINVTLRKKFNLFANVRPVKSFIGTKARYDNIDIITVRENTQGMYSGLGQTTSEDGSEAQAMSMITREGAEKIITFAYELALRENRKKVTTVHKANILKALTGLFLETAMEIGKEYGNKLEIEERIVDNTAMQLVIDPAQFNIILTTNMFGDILSDEIAGLIGGLGLAPGGNIGDDVAIFEAVHGTAPDIAGKGIANPTALYLASAMMLEHINQNNMANNLRKAIRETLKNKKNRTIDLGGEASTKDYMSYVIDNLN